MKHLVGWKKRINAPLLLMLSAVFGTVMFLVHQQSISVDRYASDTQAHIIILYRVIYEPGYYISHPLWHIITFVLSKLLQISVENAAAVSSALFVTFWTYLVYFVVQTRLRPSIPLISLAVMLIVILVGPLCIPWYNKIIFYGQGSPNVWHNLTLWAVKPFALLSMLFFLRGLVEGQKSSYLYSIIFAIISIFAKPSFIIMYLPALALFGLLRHLYTHRDFLVYFVAIGVLSTAILAYQFLHTFYHGESEVIIDLLGVWSLSSQNISFSIMLGLAFPLLFTLLEADILKDDSVLLSWIMVIVGIVYYAVFAQTGRFYAHGNFGWSYMIAMSLLYLFSIVKFFEIFHRIASWKRYPLLMLLLVQTAIGIFYLEKLLLGQDPLYTAIFL
jgi:hypothetical protein